MLKKILIFLWASMFAVMLLVAGLFFAISQGWIGYLPDINELQNPTY